jgi:DNA-directed RNA polymerase subunit M/transcription elongation factor TFIIS
MKLPTISTPIYEVKFLSRKEPVKFRPFLVREQKLMMLAVESNDIKETIDLMKRIAKNCILDQNIDVEELPIADLEILFLNLRARSMGEKMSVYYKCKNIVPAADDGTEECGMVINVDVNLLEVPVINTEFDKKIKITDDVGMQLKYPSFNFINDILNQDNTNNPDAIDTEFKAAAMSIEFIYDKDNVYYAKDATLDELLEFVNNLPQEKYNLIGEFLNKTPTASKTTHVNCPKCSFAHTFVLEGLNDFFT